MLANAFVLLGGIAMFLFGMGLMGDGLKKAAGNKLELILYKLTSTPLKGILLGTGVTAIIQSSGATSIMAVGFVNAEMMKVRQAIGVIMGAIIGTSVTGWVLCLSELGDSGIAGILSTETLASLVAIIGIILRMASKKKQSKFISDILLGFAVLMFGMKTMSGAVSGLKDEPAFISILTGFKNPLLGVLFGVIATAVLQSASASVGILQALSSTGVITFEIALPIILGIGIGASVPVLLSGIGSTTDGKRTALSYLVIEVLRVIVFAIPYGILNAVLHFGFTEMVMDMVSIAALNSAIRIVTVLLLIPAIGLIEKIVTEAIKPDPREQDEMKDFTRLEERFIAYPALAVEQARLVINSMAQKAKKSIYDSVALIDNFTEEGFSQVESMESSIDKYEDKIGTYLMKVAGRDMTQDQSVKLTKFLNAITDFERIGDHALNIAESAREIYEKKISFSDKGQHELEVLSQSLLEAVSVSVKAFIDDDVNLAGMMEPLEQTIDDLCDEAKLHHTNRLRDGDCSLEQGFVFNDLLTNFERVSDHCANIAIAVIETKENTMDSHEFEEKLKNPSDANYREFLEEYKQKYHI